VEPPELVRAGGGGGVVVRYGGLRLALRGTAERDGALGERVVVRTEFGQRLEGVVEAEGTVVVEGPDGGGVR